MYLIGLNVNNIHVLGSDTTFNIGNNPTEVRIFKMSQNMIKLGYGVTSVYLLKDYKQSLCELSPSEFNLYIINNCKQVI